jgi:outer membrane biogenesis lipoprotein LolB
MRAYFEIITALKPLPTDSGILYTYAMAAEKAGRFDVMESTLRQILKKTPNDANTLNALGYSLADRKQNLPEAFALITKAHNLAPQDAFILDSLGWVNFRLGKLELARDQLSKAAQMKPEAEISAHLGEVYWAIGNLNAAESAWRDAERMDANNATLRETLKRFKPNWVMPNQSTKIVWNGRFSIRMNGGADRPAEGGSGGFTLSQDALNDTLEIRNPVGGSIAKITITPGEAVLERGGKISKAIDADTLIQSALGLPLPARGLSDWLRGQVRPGSPASLERNPNGIVSKISQDGWNLSYVWGESSSKLEKLNMTRNTKTGPIDIRLVFDQIDD